MRADPKTLSHGAGTRSRGIKHGVTVKIRTKLDLDGDRKVLIVRITSVLKEISDECVQYSPDNAGAED